MVSQSKGGTEHLVNLQRLRGACNGVNGRQSQANFLARLADGRVLAVCVAQLPEIRA